MWRGVQLTDQLGQARGAHRGQQLGSAGGSCRKVDTFSYFQIAPTTLCTFALHQNKCFFLKKAFLASLWQRVVDHDLHRIGSDFVFSPFPIRTRSWYKLKSGGNGCNFFTTTRMVTAGSVELCRALLGSSLMRGVQVCCH